MIFVKDDFVTNDVLALEFIAINFSVDDVVMVDPTNEKFTILGMSLVRSIGGVY